MSKKEWLDKNVPEELSSEEFWLETMRKFGRQLEYVPKALHDKIQASL
jgi:hypothetical protein